MANIFEETYVKVLKLRGELQAPYTNSEVKKLIQAEFRRLVGQIDALGPAASRIWRDYEAALDNGNKVLDINDRVKKEDVESLVRCMRENGILEFTFSSGWTDSAETAWLFVQNGCRVTRMAEVYGQRDWFNDNKQEVRHGYLFEIV